MAKTDFEMVHYNQNNKIVSALRTRNDQVELEKDPINITYGILDQTFKVLDQQDTSARQIILCLATLSKKSENVIVNIVKKPYNFVEKKLKTMLKEPKWSWEITSRFLKRRERRKVCWAYECFCQNLGITAYTSENYSNFKNKFLFNNGGITEINDNYNKRSKGNISFTELCVIINTLSNQDFVGLDKFRLRTSLGTIQEMHVKMNKTENHRNESYMSDFLSSLSTPVMTNLAAGSSSGESASLTLDRRDSLESKFLRVSTEKNSCLQETASLLNQYIGKENQSWLQNDKELEILQKDFKKQMKENKSLTLKLCQKKKN